MRRFNTPWQLEMMHIFHKESFDPVPGWNFSEQFNQCMIGPNIHLKGVALRINAQKRMENNEDSDHILPDLQESEVYLIQSGDPTEFIECNHSNPKSHNGILCFSVV